MNQNEYDPAKVVEIGKAQDVLRGWKDIPEVGDSLGNPPLDRLYVE